ncbi:MAG: VPLPA-CTERM sorting domain-containing protein [Thiogranum sp.]|jgi:hypothetical protein
MKKLFAALCLALLGQQASAIGMDVPGYDFAAFAQFAGSSGGTFTTNYGTPEASIADDSAATWVMDGVNSGGTQINMDPNAYFDLSFGTTDVFDGVGNDLSVFFVGAPPHDIGLSLFANGGSQSSTIHYNSVSYTGYNVEDPAFATWAIYVMNIDLADFSFLGTSPIEKIRLGIGNASAVPSFVGAYNTTPVPVPAAVWLFGSGLLGLAGIARKRA